MPHYERSSIKEKNIIKGHNRRDTVSKNWQYWGKNGVFMNHFMYEFGVAAAIVRDNFGPITISDDDITALKKDGYAATFKDLMSQVVQLGTYERYSSEGWSRQLANTIRTDLVPLIVRGVVLGWYQSILMNRNAS